MLEGVHPYAARPGVDVYDEVVGEELRGAVWGLMEHPDNYSPEDVRAIFESLLTDIAIKHGWFRDCDDHWYMPVLPS